MPDDLIYHYTSASTAFERILPSGSLRMSPIARMRDPLENRVPPAPSVVSRTATSDQLLAALRLLEKEIAKVWGSARLLSLTLDRAGTEWYHRGWASARMWEFYADRHAGVCLELRKEALVEAVIRSLQQQGLAKPYHQPVQYVSQVRHAMRRAIDLASYPDGFTAPEVWRHLEQVNQALFFNKADEWASEHEFRFVVTAPDTDWVYVDVGVAVQAVIVGDRFPTWQLVGAKDACTNARAKLRQLQWTADSPYLRDLG